MKVIGNERVKKKKTVFCIYILELNVLTTASLYTHLLQLTNHNVVYTRKIFQKEIQYIKCIKRSAFTKIIMLS